VHMSMLWNHLTYNFFGIYLNIPQMDCRP